jgi:hypothetical protein
LIYEFAIHEIPDGMMSIMATFVELVKQIMNSKISFYSKFRVIPLYKGNHFSVNKNMTNSLIIGTAETFAGSFYKIKNISVLIIVEVHLIDDWETDAL